MQNRTIYEIIGEAVLLASVQIGLFTIEMSSKFEIMNTQSQSVLQGAADSLSSYMVIGIIWTIGSVFLLYGQFGIPGIVAGLLANIVFILWIVIGYLRVFSYVSKNSNLKYPRLFQTISFI